MEREREFETGGQRELETCRERELETCGERERVRDLWGEVERKGRHL